MPLISLIHAEFIYSFAFQWIKWLETNPCAILYFWYAVMLNEPRSLKSWCFPTPGQLRENVSASTCPESQFGKPGFDKRRNSRATRSHQNVFGYVTREPSRWSSYVSICCKFASLIFQGPQIETVWCIRNCHCFLRSSMLSHVHLMDIPYHFSRPTLKGLSHILQMAVNFQLRFFHPIWFTLWIKYVVYT